MFRQSPVSVIPSPFGKLRAGSAEGSSPDVTSGRSRSARWPSGLDSSTPLRSARNDINRSVIFTSILSLVFISFLLLPIDVYAKRKLPSAAGGKPAAKSSAGAVTAKVKFRADRRAVILNLANLGAAKSVSYELQYETNGLMQGAGGSVTIEGNSQSREILFGSCSSGVCNYDKNIKNAKLTVTTTLKTGKKIIKPFKLKV